MRSRSGCHEDVDPSRMGGDENSMSSTACPHSDVDPSHRGGMKTNPFFIRLGVRMSTPPVWDEN